MVLVSRSAAEDPGASVNVLPLSLWVMTRVVPDGGVADAPGAGVAVDPADPGDAVDEEEGFAEAGAWGDPVAAGVDGDPGADGDAEAVAADGAGLAPGEPPGGAALGWLVQAVRKATPRITAAHAVRRMRVTTIPDDTPEPQR